MVDTAAKDPMANEPTKSGLNNETALAIQELAAAMMAQAPKTPLEMSGLSKEAQRVLTSAGAPKKFRHVPCKSERTGSTFDAHVVESKAHPNGRIVQLLNYRHPEGITTFQANGGLVPDGFPVLKDSTQGVPQGEEIPFHMLGQNYLQWRWTEFWQRDLRDLIGSELKAHHCKDADAFKTPWVAGKTATVDAE